MTTTVGAEGDVLPLVVRTVPLDLGEGARLLDLVPSDEPVAWLRRGEGLVGWGVAARIRVGGHARFAEAESWWSETVRHAIVRDEVRQPGSGLVAFGAFAFADEPGESVLVVPRVVVGRRGLQTWVTTIGTDNISTGNISTGSIGPGSIGSGGIGTGMIGKGGLTVTDAPRAPRGLGFSDGSLTPQAWQAVVAEAVARIGGGELEKVVLARDVLATTSEPVDVRWPLRRLDAQYPMCWTFHVDGLFGATPEMLVRRERGLVTSRVLAGTIRRSGDDARDLALAATLARSSKDLEEHEYAVRSVADALAPHCSSMLVPESPFVLHLPNVMHLATDIAGVAHDAATVSSLRLAEALHPTAAVGGTPTKEAVALIAQIEGMDRARYAGPVGWIDATGDGEWAIALRSAEVRGKRVRLFAGCGIVADSDPEDELTESRAKLVPVHDALSAGATLLP